MSHVSLGVSKAKDAKFGSFVANYYEDGKPRKSKTVAVNLEDEEAVKIAYETVDLWGEDKAKEMVCEYKKLSLKEITIRLQDALDGTLSRGLHTASTRKTTVKGPITNLGHVKFFKYEMKRAFAELGAEKIKNVLKEGTKYLNELESERVKVAKNSGKAKESIARAMYTTFVDTGVDTSVYCSDEEIIFQFKTLVAESRQAEINL